MKKVFILSVTLLVLSSTYSFALTSEQAPIDSKGSALIDPDQKFDDMAATTSNNGYSTTNVNFGGVNFSMTGNSSNGQSANVPRPATVQTGNEMFDPMMPIQRWHQ